jgi:alpha-1,2-mannosyltransferase
LIVARTKARSTVPSSAASALPSRRRELYAAAVRHGVFGAVPVLATIYLLALFYDSSHLFASDFHRSYWPAAFRILHGQSAYIDPKMLNITVDVPFSYPAVGALLFAPFGLISNGLGGVIFTLLNIAALMLTLRILDVRDWRLYGVVLLWLPVISAWETANITLLIGLGIATAWRYRERPALVGLALAVLISVKPFFWPLGFWLLASRRYRALAYTMACGLLVNAVAWSILGFDQIPRYTRLAGAFTKDGERIGYSVVSLLLQLGSSRSVAYAVTLALAAAAAAGCVAAGRRGRERTALALCLAVTLLLTPIIWLHYFALLAIPLALKRPKLSVAWAVPMAMWLCLPTDNPATWQVAIALAACVGVFVAVLRSPLSAGLNGRVSRKGAAIPVARSPSARSAH